MTIGHCSDHYCLFEGSVQGEKEDKKGVCGRGRGGVGWRGGGRIEVEEGSLMWV